MNKTVTHEKLKSSFKRFLIIWFLTLGIYITITIIWGLAEMKIYGHTRPNDIDSIVTFILTVLIFDRLKIKINV